MDLNIKEAVFKITKLKTFCKSLAHEENPKLASQKQMGKTTMLLLSARTFYNQVSVAPLR